MAKKANGRGGATMPLIATSSQPPMLLPCRKSIQRSLGVAEEQQLGNIHEVALKAMEDGQMGEDEEKENEDKDDNEASQLREEEEEKKVEERARKLTQTKKKMIKGRKKRRTARERELMEKQTKPLQSRFSPPNLKLLFM